MEKRVKKSGMVKIYNMIFDRIKEMVEKEGVLPWQRAWSVCDNMPSNFVSKKPYRGINIFILAMAAYDCP